MTLLPWLALLAWIWLLLAHGRFWVPEARPTAPLPGSWPEVVAVVPARDEAAVIGRAVASLLTQDYPGRLSVVVTDDSSSDGTARTAMEAAAFVDAAERLTVVTAPPPEPGWSGKMWAQSRGLAAAADHHPGAELWLLTDADIGHHPAELRRMVAQLLAERLDMASLMVRLVTATAAEKAVIPAFVFFFRMLYPFRWVGDPTRPTAAAAGGYMLVRRSMLERIGGLAAISGALIDDCSLAARIKGHGGRLSLALSGDTVSLRGYEGLSGLWKMIARSAYTQLHCSPLLLAGTVLAMGIGFLLPPAAALACHSLPGWLAWAAMSVAFAPMLRFYRLPVILAPLLPLVAIFYLGATVDSARRHWQGRGGEWKGRVQAK